ncbi:MAG: TIGR00159 family protein [Bacteroidetes bacterium]|nr:TIGR00159 family protein [Bacteroidota bacterium]
MDFRIIDAIDILLVSFILYVAYNLVKGTSAVNIFIGLAFIYFAYIIFKAFDFKLLSLLLSKFVNVGVIVVMIIFQPEIRKFLLYIGSSEFLKKVSIQSVLKMSFNRNSANTIPLNISDILNACFILSASKTGALIIITRKTDLKFYIDTGEIIDAAVTSRMLENIFFKNSPLHDGAVIINDNKIIAARCILPVTENPNFPSHFGMRHRAALGITENTDALAISVSEQTGAVSLSIHGEINADLSKEKLNYLLEKNLIVD